MFAPLWQDARQDLPELSRPLLDQAGLARVPGRQRHGLRRPLLDVRGMAEKADGTCIQFWWSSPATLDAVYETMEAAAAAKSEASVNVADDEANEVAKN